MGGKSSIPEPPDYGPLVDASVESAEMWTAVAREQLDWAREQHASNQELLQTILGPQIEQLDMAFENARKDRERYEEVYQPVEDDLIREFQEIGTPEDTERYAAQRMADVRTQFEAQRRNQLQQLEDYGIDPSQTRNQALDLGYRAQEAASAALAANQGRESREQLGRALRSEAINIGRGMPAQVAQSQGIVNQTAGGAINNATNVTNTGANAWQAGAASGGLGQAGYMNAGSLQNQGFQNQMDAWQAQQDATMGWINAGMGAIGMIPGMGMPPGMEEGGSVPEDIGPAGPSDEYPVLLSDDEFIIPADVVKRKGTEFFDKLLDKYQDGGEYEQKRREAIPAR